MNNLEIFKEDIVDYNIIVNDGKDLGSKSNLILGCFSSYHYYDNIFEQISSVFRCLILNHAFVDGNKRTALLFLYNSAFEFELNIKLTEDELYELIVVQIIQLKIDVEEIAKLLFNNES